MRSNQDTEIRILCEIFLVQIHRTTCSKDDAINEKGSEKGCVVSKIGVRVLVALNRRHTQLQGSLNAVGAFEGLPRRPLALVRVP